MPNVDEIMRDDEAYSYRLTMEGESRRLSTVTLANGHVVDMVVRRSDGVTAWVDQTCQRATAPSYNAGSKGFIDENVAAWHNYTNGVDMTLPPHERELTKASKVLAAARAARVEELAEIERVQAELTARKVTATKAVTDALKARDAAITEASERGMHADDIAATVVDLTRTGVLRVLTKAQP